MIFQKIFLNYFQYFCILTKFNKLKFQNKINIIDKKVMKFWIGDFLIFPIPTCWAVLLMFLMFTYVVSIVPIVRFYFYAWGNMPLIPPMTTTCISSALLSHSSSLCSTVVLMLVLMASLVPMSDVGAYEGSLFHGSTTAEGNNNYNYNYNNGVIRPFFHYYGGGEESNPSTTTSTRRRRALVFGNQYGIYNPT